MTNTESLTLPLFSVAYAPEPDCSMWFDTREAAERYRRERMSFFRGEVVDHSRTYRVGDEVWVQAFGRPRFGEVVALNRKTVVVRFVRNALGYVTERKFSGSSVWHV